MSRSATFRALSFVVVVCLLSTNVLAEAAAMLEPTGTVLVNDSQVMRVSTVFPGDRVKTGSGSAVISAKGTTVLLAANSSLTIGPTAMALDEGSASTTLAPGQRAEVGSLTLTPAGNEPASYDVDRGCGFVRITVKSGALNVSANGGAPVTLTAGNSHKFEVAKTAECGGQANSTQPVMSNRAAIITGGVVALAAGLIVWFTTDNDASVVGP